MRHLLFFLLLVPATAIAQFPSTDIHIAPLTLTEDGVTVGEFWNATDHPGYDNQPGFFADGSQFYFTSSREGEQTEIFLYNLTTKESSRVTDTAESEYSPTPLPDGRFSTVRVETDSTGTQRLWSLDAEGGTATVILEDVTGVGYHTWINDTELLLFVVGDPHTLHRADTTRGTSVELQPNIGRAIHRIPGQAAMSFTQQLDEEHWVIRRLDLENGAVSDIANCVGTSQDLAWTPWRALWMTDGNRVVEWNDGEWTTVVDTASAGIEGMTRLAVSPDGRWLAVVAAEPTEEESP